MKMFPGLFDCVYLFAQAQGWNKLKGITHTLKEPLHIKRNWNRRSKRWSQQLQELANTTDGSDKIVKVGNVVIGKADEFRIDGTEVFLGLREDGTEVAVRRAKDDCEVLKNEKDFLCLIDDASIVRYWDFVEDENYGYLCLQLCECTLEDHIKNQSLSESVRRAIAEQVLKGLNKLHCQNPPILHRNLKPQNVLIGKLQKKSKTTS